MVFELRGAERRVNSKNYERTNHLGAWRTSLALSVAEWVGEGEGAAERSDAGGGGRRPPREPKASDRSLVVLIIHNLNTEPIFLIPISKMERVITIF